MDTKKATSDIVKRIGENIRKYRKLAELSHVQLYTKSGIHWNAISEIERGKRNPTATTLEKLAKALGVDVGKFFE